MEGKGRERNVCALSMHVCVCVCAPDCACICFSKEGRDVEMCRRVGAETRAQTMPSRLCSVFGLLEFRA